MTNKRSRDDDEPRACVGAGSGDTEEPIQDATAATSKAADMTAVEDDDNSSEWQQVKRRKTTKKEANNYPSITHSPHARLQSFVKLSDLQNLVLYALADGNAPQWVSVKHHGSIRKVVVLMVPGLEAGMFDGSIPLSSSTEESSSTAVQAADHTATNRAADARETAPGVSRKLNVSPDDYYPAPLRYSQLPQPLQPLSDLFEYIWPIKTPGEDKYARMHSPLQAMLVSPIVKSREDKRAKGPQPPPEGRGWKNQRTPVTELLATTTELSDDGYVLHPAHYNQTSSATKEIALRELNKTTTADGWIETPDVPFLFSGNVPDKDIEKGSVTAGRNVLTMDCEMCITSPQGVAPQVFSLTRISIVDWDGNVLLDELVKPTNPITDYLTPYSGITEKMLECVTTTLEDIQKRLLGILTPQTILVGHSLNSDLSALQLAHPFIIDTALLFPHPRGPPLKSSLKWLAQKYLSRAIQKGHGSTGHDSIEDAKACLDLVKQKCEKGKSWGTPEASGEPIFKRLARSYRPNADKVDRNGENEARVSAVVDWGEPARGYGGQAKVAIGEESDEAIVKSVQRCLEGSSEDLQVPNGGCDFVWARLRELEAHRGWWDKSKLVDSDALRSTTTAASAETLLPDMVTQTVTNIKAVYDALPDRTAFIVYSGSGDPRELREMQALQTKFKEEYKTKKWDQLSVKWTDVEEQKLRAACDRARRGIGFVGLK
ncbi:hypothetical protein LTR78_004588 [Recurvomyces mirabilis]|uniref:Exonuclease domain-containing protein n=1 Tax=Recurvomyces mirabilis TaxID=574656 RepID=A0AAE1C2G9_9PEZI|nr:hypothetical protein LTR78_004588 [Recurvomyces mirabilis]KAK5152918.1 hypothetical protein LTS14_008026 [Recurvomyces mirabilis]